jgi:MarR family transcriptional regulator for hemolysin
MVGASHDCADDFLAVVLMVIQAVRVEMRSRRPPELTVPQFCTLVFLTKFPGASLSDLAENVGLRLPSMSKMINSLVDKGLVIREGCAENRRRVALSLTPKGSSIYGQASWGIHAALARRLKSLSQEESAELRRAMQAVQRIFAPQRKA